MTKMSKKTENEKKYSADNITVLEGLEAVRKRPGMYIGDTGVRGVHHLIWEILDNACDEALAGYCNKITITLKNDSVTISDNGRGIPTDIHKTQGKSALEVVFTVLHAGGKFDGNSYGFAGGLHGVGASVVNALSSELKVSVSHGEGSVFVQKYKKGVPCGDVKETKSKAESGTTVQFTPDTEIFKDFCGFDINIIKTRISEMSYLLPDVKVILNYGEGEDLQKCTYHKPNGVKSFILDFVKGTLESSVSDESAYIESQSEKSAESDIQNTDNEENNIKSDTDSVNLITSQKNIFSVKKEQDKFITDVSLAYTDSYSESLFSFVNLIPTAEGGTHVSGFRGALTKAVNNCGKKAGYIKDKQPNLTGSELSEGLVAIVSVYMTDPQFEGQTKGRLGSSEADSIVGSVVYEALTEWFTKYPKELKAIIDKAVNARKARNAAKAASDLARKSTSRASLHERLDIQSKLAGCSSRNAAECELFLVEGDSAGGSAKQARDRGYQAILPLRGKVLNVHRASAKQIGENKEICDLIQVLGCGVKSHCDPSKLRYGKIILMTDADVDGAHIAVLLLTFFYNMMPKILEEGHIYLARPPLYRISEGNNEEYLYSDEELKNRTDKFKKKNTKYRVQRYKGLGEMNPEQLRETTMLAETRVLKRINIEDVKTAAEDFDLFMGDDASLRRNYIIEHSEEVKADV